MCERLRVLDEILVETRLELLDRGVAGVDDDVGAFPQTGQQPALFADAVDDRTVQRQWMAAARLLEASYESLVGRLEEHQRVLHPPLTQLVEAVLQATEVLAAADVADDGDAVDLAALAPKEIDEGGHEIWRQVVDAEPPGVLEGVHGLRLTGPRKARDDHELQCARHASLPPLTSTPSSASRRSFQAGSSP